MSFVQYCLSDIADKLGVFHATGTDDYLLCDHDADHEVSDGTEPSPWCHQRVAHEIDSRVDGYRQEHDQSRDHARCVRLLFVKDLYGGNVRKALYISQEYSCEDKEGHIGEKQRHKADEQYEDGGHKAAEMRVFLGEFQFFRYHGGKSARELSFFPEVQDYADVEEADAPLQHCHGRPVDRQIYEHTRPQGSQDI